MSDRRCANRANIYVCDMPYGHDGDHNQGGVLWRNQPVMTKESAMSDPAVEAAEREWDKHKIIPFYADCLYGKSLISTAREALAPLRELHRPIRGTGTCEEDGDDWPCATAKLIYPEGEL